MTATNRKLLLEKQFFVQSLCDDKLMFVGEFLIMFPVCCIFLLGSYGEVYHADWNGTVSVFILCYVTIL